MERMSGIRSDRDCFLAPETGRNSVLYKRDALAFPWLPGFTGFLFGGG